MDWKMYLVQDDFGDLWIIYSPNAFYATARVFDITHQKLGSESTRELTPQECEFYQRAVSTAQRLKNVPIFVEGSVKRAEEYGERTGRPFPQAYDDWAQLAKEINAKYPDDPVMRASVNFSLQQVAQEYGEPTEAREERLQEAEEAKRWLARKAGELGIT